MKFKLLLIIFSVAFSANVKFNLDMSLQDVGSEGPTLWMGAFYESPYLMEDNDGDNIWSYTINLEEYTSHINLEMVGGEIGIQEVVGKKFQLNARLVNMAIEKLLLQIKI